MPNEINTMSTALQNIKENNNESNRIYNNHKNGAIQIPEKYSKLTDQSARIIVLTAEEIRDAPIKNH